MKKKHRDLLDSLKEASMSPLSYENEPAIEDDYLVLPKTEKVKDDIQRVEDDKHDAWMEALAPLTEPVYLSKAKKIKEEDLLYPIETKKERKKRKKEKHNSKEPTDFEKMFATEEQALTNLMRKQTAFVESLQNEWDNTVSKKSTSRGVTKTTTEVANNISTGRNLLLSIIKEKTALKTKIAELTMKEKKELGLIADDENDLESLGFRGSDFIRQVMSERASMANNSSTADLDIIDLDNVNPDEIFNDENVNLDERSIAASKYIEFEVMNPTIYVKVYDYGDKQAYDYVVLAENGDDITSEYPLPSHTDLSYNQSTKVATSSLGQKYDIIE